MGNIGSKGNKKTLLQVVDYVATNYILSQNFEDMKDLSNLDKCNKLVVITSNVIERKLNNKQIKYLSQRLKNGVEINEMASDKLMYIKKDDVDELDVINKTTKRRLCIGISKFYIKIAHLFAAITSTLNPIYEYTDEYGTTKQVSLLEKHTIPKTADIKVNKMNLCSNRINSLLNNNDYSDLSTFDTIKVNPNFCNINIQNGNLKILSDEVGIPELETLYYDTYDYDKGGFTGMSQETRENKYEKDVKLLYKAFTGKSEVPDYIKKFSDIKLKNYHESEGCSTDGHYTHEYEGTGRLFYDYANHIKTMTKTSKINQDKLISIIDQLFIIVLDPVNGEKKTIINPEMNETKLQKLVEKTRELIINYYIQCEDDYAKGLEIFEAIVESKVLESTKNQIAILNNTIEKEQTGAEIETPSAEIETPKSEIDASTYSTKDSKIDDNTVTPLLRLPYDESMFSDAEFEPSPTSSPTSIKSVDSVTSPHTEDDLFKESPTLSEIGNRFSYKSDADGDKLSKTTQPTALSSTTFNPYKINITPDDSETIKGTSPSISIPDTDTKTIASTSSTFNPYRIKTAKETTSDTFKIPTFKKLITPSPRLSIKTSDTKEYDSEDGNFSDIESIKSLPDSPRF